MKRFIPFLLLIILLLGTMAHAQTTGFSLTQSVNATVSVAMSDTAQTAGAHSYRFGLFVDNSTITNATVVPYGRWMKNYAVHQTPDSLRALVMVPSYATGSVRMAYGFADNGNILATTTLVTLSKGQGWRNVSLPVNIQGVNFTNLTIALSYESGQEGTEVMFLGRVSLVYNALGTVLTLDDGNGIPSSGVPSIPQLSSPANSSSLTAGPLLAWNAVVSAATYNLQVATDAVFTAMAVNQTGLTGTNYQTQLAVGTYYWRVSATNSSGTSEWSTMWSFTITTPVTLPTVPTLTSPADGSSVSSSPLFRWTNGTNAVFSNLLVASDPNFALLVIHQEGLSGTSYQSQLTVGTYYWKVSNSNTAGVGPHSGIWSFTIAAPPTVPDPPVLLSPMNGTSNTTSPVIIWNASANAIIYNLQIAADMNFANLVIYQSGITGTSYQTQLAPNTYYWRVSATGVSGTSAYSSSWSFTITTPLPGVPILLTPVYGTTAMIDPIAFSWQASQNASEYEIQIAVSIFFTDVKYSAAIVGTHITFSYFSPNTTYHWRVRGKNASGVSSWSSVSYFSTASATDVDEKAEIPQKFSLSQNYPNPFNPTTSIKYTVASSKYVTLKVYDVLGKEIAMLVDEEKFPGSYEVQFNASNLPSGVYFYRINAGAFVETKKMLLQK